MFHRSPLIAALTLLALPGCITGKDEEANDTAPEEEVNEPPVAVDDVASVFTGHVVTIDLTDNDNDPNTGDDLLVSGTSQPENGIVEILNDNEVSYTSLNDYVGVDGFTYTVTDEGGLSDEASVTLNVQDLPTLVVTAPDDASSHAGPDIDVSFEVNGCEVTHPSENEYGCHVHKYLDGVEYKDEDQTGFGHYSTASFTLTPVAAGSHEFKLVLIKNDGSDSAFEPEISDSVTFEVEDDSSSGTDCPGSFSGTEGPGCCSNPNETGNDLGRATCGTDGVWTCASGAVCTCNGDSAQYECVDACDGSLSALPACVYSDHWECMNTTPVSTDDCP